jgi:hypothetical protein
MVVHMLKVSIQKLIVMNVPEQIFANIEQLRLILT